MKKSPYIPPEVWRNQIIGSLMDNGVVREKAEEVADELLAMADEHGKRLKEARGG